MLYEIASRKHVFGVSENRTQGRTTRDTDRLARSNGHAAADAIDYEDTGKDARPTLASAQPLGRASGAGAGAAAAAAAGLAAVMQRAVRAVRSCARRDKHRGQLSPICQQTLTLEWRRDICSCLGLAFDRNPRFLLAMLVE